MTPARIKELLAIAYDSERELTPAEVAKFCGNPCPQRKPPLTCHLALSYRRMRPYLIPSDRQTNGLPVPTPTGVIAVIEMIIAIPMIVASISHISIVSLSDPQGAV